MRRHLHWVRVACLSLLFLCFGNVASAALENAAIWENGRPTNIKNLHEVDAKVQIIYEPRAKWTYSHHPFITVFKGQAYAMWSNGKVDEDAPGQRILLSTSRNFTKWSQAKTLLIPENGQGDRADVLTAAGFYQTEDSLLAYVVNSGPQREHTRLWYLETKDGIVWSGPYDTGLPVMASHPPVRVGGKLIIAGNFSLPGTHDLRGKTGWKLAGIFPPGWSGMDTPSSFAGVSAALGLDASLCEAAIVNNSDGIITVAFRNAAKPYGNLWMSQSRDNGETWSRPVESAFSDTNAKFVFGALRDGRRFYIGTPIASDQPRSPLVLSLSSDGYRFDHSFVIGRTHRAMVYSGRYKGGEYGYPDAIVDRGFLRVIVSRQKEAIEVISVPLSELK